jgi:chaperonin GroEL (HSP60 family)
VLKPANFDQQLGVSIIRAALSRPTRQIVENAGEEGSVVVGRLLENPGDFAYGYDASVGEYKDMIAAGILDPLKVVRTALQDASGVSSLLFTSECCVVEAEEDKPAPGGMGGSEYAAMAGAAARADDLSSSLSLSGRHGRHGVSICVALRVPARC